MRPHIKQDPLYQLLRTEDIAGFNAARKKMDTSHLKGSDYRGLDLRIIEVDGLDFSDAYFRGADLRGIDFRQCNLRGASLAEARVSGCYFPLKLPAMEIMLSIERGTRLRY